MAIGSNDVTIYGIKNGMEKRFWVGYLILVLVSSIFGDTVILVVSAKQHAFKLNVIIVAIIQLMAACDLIISVTYVGPTIISIITDGWILGDRLAYAHKFVEVFVIPINIILVCLLTTSKLAMLQYPIQTRCWSKIRAHVACSIVWLSFTFISTVSLILRKDSLIFDYTSYEFDTDYSLSGPTGWGPLPIVEIRHMTSSSVI